MNKITNLQFRAHIKDDRLKVLLGVIFEDYSSLSLLGEGSDTKEGLIEALEQVLKEMKEE